MKRWTLLTAIVFWSLAASCASGEFTEKQYTNSLGMKFVRIEPGEFKMGQSQTSSPEVMPSGRGRGVFDHLSAGDFDEKPAHKVAISKPLYMGNYKVTNFQYELFDPEHKKIRGQKRGSKNDQDPAVFVSWYDAQAFCRWLSDLEGVPYRLPTEAEWEFACRAGTTTRFHTGDTFPLESRGSSLKIGETKPNSWGLFDMHRNAEEWCHDWYGPYRAEAQTDPVGYIDGDFRVTRGGSDGTSANRHGALPNDKNWVTGFRVVIGSLPDTRPLPSPEPPLNQRDVQQRPVEVVTRGPDPGKPYFSGPRKYINIPTSAHGPLFASHNHDPAIVECPNGDLLTIWYTCVSESGRELAQAASRLTLGAEQWQPASLFWDAPGRNDHAPALWFDGKGRLYHFTGMSAGAGHGDMILVMRTSDDSGATWSRARIIGSDYTPYHMPSEPVFRAQDGSIILVTDWPNVDGLNASGLWISRDEGLTWTDPGGHIMGIHAAAAQLKNGDLLGYGRPEAWIAPQSVSRDMGKTFTYSESDFPAVGGNQRGTLLRLREGPLLMTGFADRGIDIVDASGKKRRVHGLFTAVSEDEGKTWPYMRLVTDGSGKIVECMNGGLFIMGQRTAEYKGYLSICQSLDGVIHLISSRQHYAFNLAWLKTPTPAETTEPLRVEHMVETFNGPDDFDNKGWVDYRSYRGSFNGKGQFTINAPTRHSGGINRILGAGSFELSLSMKNISFHQSGGRSREGSLTLSIQNDRARYCAVHFSNNGMELEIRDLETAKSIPGARYREGFGWRWEKPQGRYDRCPESLAVKMSWDQRSRRLRISYGMDGAEAQIELPQSRDGIIFGEPMTESTTFYIAINNGTMEVDHLEITPTNN